MSEKSVEHGAGQAWGVLLLGPSLSVRLWRSSSRLAGDRKPTRTAGAAPATGSHLSKIGFPKRLPRALYQPAPLRPVAHQRTW